MVEAPLVGVARCQRLDTQVKGDDAILAHGIMLPFFPALAGPVFTVLVVLFRIVIDE